jgi:IS30 family transposase
MKTKRHFTQLSIEEREEIQVLLAEGYSRRAIAERLGRNHSSIVRELQKSRSFITKRYTPRLAQERTHLMRQARGRRTRLKNKRIRTYVEEKLRLKWSPEQIAGRLPRDHPRQHISHEAIYQYIYSRVEREGWGVKVRGEDLRPYLRRSHKRRRRKNVPYPSKQGQIRNRTSIEQRPQYIEKRRQLGHWEGDSMVSKQSSAGLNSLVERATGFTKLKKLGDGGAVATTTAVTQQLAPLPEHLRRTLTTDNGKENANHEVITAHLKMRWYFCHAYASHERGTNENTNGLVRDYFPKKTDFALIPDERIQDVEDLLNDRPRKRLKYKTPREVFTHRGALTG